MIDATFVGGEGVKEEDVAGVHVDPGPGFSGEASGVGVEGGIRWGRKALMVKSGVDFEGTVVFVAGVDGDEGGYQMVGRQSKVFPVGVVLMGKVAVGSGWFGDEFVFGEGRRSFE